jgi:hypothetical protein
VLQVANAALMHWHMVYVTGTCSAVGQVLLLSV